MSPNNAIMFNGVVRPKLLNSPIASCSFIYLDLLLPYTVHFHDKNGLPFSVFNIFESIFSVFFSYFK